MMRCMCVGWKDPVEAVTTASEQVRVKYDGSSGPSRLEETSKSFAWVGSVAFLTENDFSTVVVA